MKLLNVTLVKGYARLRRGTYVVHFKLQVHCEMAPSPANESIASIAETNQTKWHPIFSSISNHRAPTKVNDRRKMFLCLWIYRENNIKSKKKLLKSKVFPNNKNPRKKSTEI